MLYMHLGAAASGMFYRREPFDNGRRRVMPTRIIRSRRDWMDDKDRAVLAQILTFGVLPGCDENCQRRCVHVPGTWSPGELSH
jgi:hypothetical protein